MGFQYLARIPNISIQYSAEYFTPVFGRTRIRTVVERKKKTSASR